jgi:hypothetical protein
MLYRHFVEHTVQYTCGYIYTMETVLWVFYVPNSTGFIVWKDVFPQLQSFHIPQGIFGCLNYHLFRYPNITLLLICLPILLYNGYRVSFPWVKQPGRGVDHPPPSSTEVKERVELYLYSPSGPSWPVLGRTLPLLIFFRALCELCCYVMALPRQSRIGSVTTTTTTTTTTTIVAAAKMIVDGGSEGQWTF